MKRKSMVAVSILVFVAALPAQSQKDPPPIFMTSAPPSERPAEKSALSAIPLGSAGVLAGLTVGVPIKISKSITDESRRMTGTLIDDMGGSGKLIEKLFAASFGIPYGIASGTVLGSIHGVKQAIKFGYEKPFSKESFGIMEPEE